MRSISCCVAILVLMFTPAAVGTDEKADLQESFSEWIDQRVKLEYEQHSFHRVAHENKLVEKRGMDIPDWKYASDELKQASETLLDAFMKLDGVLHGGEEVTWEDVGDTISEALKKVAPHAGTLDHHDGVAVGF